MAPMFSVVIPTYNQACFLEKALNSVLQQTFKEIEVIVVNNYSTDHTNEVIGQLNDSRVQTINYRNKGIIGASRNIGIKASSGDYIAFLDSDDTWDPRKLECVSNALKTNPKIGLVCHNQKIVRDGRIIKNSSYGPPPEYEGSISNYLITIGNCVCTSATVVARSWLEQVGNFSEDRALVTVEDYDLWYRLSEVCKFQFLPDILGTQNFHPDSSSADAELHLASTLAILNKHLIEVSGTDQSIPKSAIRRRYAQAFFGAARQYHRRRTFRKPFSYYIRCLLADPLFAKPYAGLALLLIDRIFGITARKKITDNILPGI